MRPVLAVLVLASLPAIALAVPVNPTATDQVAAVSYDGYGIRLLRTNGEVWSYAVSDYGWLHEDGTQGTVNMTLPIPVSEVADWSYYFFSPRSACCGSSIPMGRSGGMSLTSRRRHGEAFRFSNNRSEG